jgi:hypothetical protein
MTWPHFISRSRQHGIIPCGGLRLRERAHSLRPHFVGPVPFGDLQGMMEKAKRALEAFEPDEVNGWAGRHLDLRIGPRKLTSETLILSFSMPNFYFHVVTAYDILRMRGVPIGKRDYEGRLRTRSY